MKRVNQASLLQATQERKVAYVPENGVDYHPDKNNASTIFAGTMVQQVRYSHSSLCRLRLAGVRDKAFCEAFRKAISRNLFVTFLLSET